MAKNSESIEGKVTTLECLSCHHRKTFTEIKFKMTDGMRCEKCYGPTRPTVTKVGESPKNGRTEIDDKPAVPPSQKKKDGLTIEVGIDVSNALKGLKAVQREAKKTAKLLKEIEQTKDFNPVINITMNGNENPEIFFKELRKQMDKLNTTY